MAYRFKQVAMQKSQHSRKYRRLLEVLRQKRESVGLTQEDVSKRLGAYSTFITKVEAGERRIDVVELAAICEVYGVKFHAFLKTAGIE